MSDAKPIGVRVVRPYASRDEFLQNEAEHLGRSHVTLVGTRSRPPGTLLRFEITLTSGEPMVRAEGRVVGPREIGEESALYVKLTRIDGKTKSLLEEAAQRKVAQRGQLSIPPGGSSAPPADRPSGNDLLASGTQEVAATEDEYANTTQVAAPSAPQAAATTPDLEGDESSEIDADASAVEAERAKADAPEDAPAVPEPTESVPEHTESVHAVPEHTESAPAVDPPSTQTDLGGARDSSVDPTELEPTPPSAATSTPAREPPTSGPQDRNALLARLRSRLR